MAFTPPAISRRVPRLFQQPTPPAGPAPRDVWGGPALASWDGTYWQAAAEAIDARTYAAAAAALGIDVADGSSHPLSAAYADAAAAAAAFPLTTAFMAVLGWQPPQTTDELAWAAIQEALLAGWAANRPVSIPMSAGQASVWLINRTLVAKTGTRLFGSAQAAWGTPIRASKAGADGATADFRNRLASGAGDPIQAVLRAYNPATTPQLDNTSRVYLEWLQLYGNDVRPAATDGAMTSGSEVLTSLSGTFTADMVGAYVTVLGAGANGGALSAQVIAVTGPTTLRLGTLPSTAVTAGTTVSGAPFVNSAEQVSGTRLVLQQPSLIRNCYFYRFGGFGLWVEGQDSHVENVAAFVCSINYRFRACQFASLVAPNSEGWLYRGFLIDGNSQSIWLKHLHAEDGTGPNDGTWLMEVVGAANVVVDTGVFTQFATTTKHHGFLVTGTAITTALSINDLRNLATITGGLDGYYAVRDYGRGVHLTWGDVGRQLHYVAPRSADVTTPLLAPWTRIYAAGAGRQVRLLGTDTNQPLLDLFPGPALAADQVSVRDAGGVVVGGVDARGVLRLPVAQGDLPLSTVRGGFGAGQNDLKDSHDLSLWTLGAAATVVANDAVAPDGTATATRVDFSSTSNAYVRNQTGVGNQNGHTLCASVWLRASAPGTILLRAFSAGPGAAQQATVAVDTAWRRCWFLSALLPGDPTSQVLFDISRTLGTHLASLWAWGAQLEEAAYPGPLVRVTGTTPKATPTPGLLAGGYAYAAIGGFASGTATFDAASVADAAMTSTTVTVQGLRDDGTWTCAVSLFVASGTKPTAGFLLSAFPDPTTINRAIVTLFNKTGGAVDLASAVVRVNAIKVAT